VYSNRKSFEGGSDKGQTKAPFTTSDRSGPLTCSRLPITKLKFSPSAFHWSVSISACDPFAFLNPVVTIVPISVVSCTPPHPPPPSTRVCPPSLHHHKPLPASSKPSLSTPATLEKKRSKWAAETQTQWGRLGPAENEGKGSSSHMIHLLDENFVRFQEYDGSTDSYVHAKSLTFCQ
jgi:hypothetical protein